MNTLDKIKELQRFGSKLGLKRMIRLMDLLGNPQEGLKVIHVGGTNGKGSVSTYTYSVLKNNGYKVGLFTSPFMDGFLNSIIINDNSMTEKELDKYYKKIEKAITKLKEEGLDSPTEFEVITALALLFFNHHKPDFVILEVGLGGVGDSTNIISKPLATVITSVSIDHCDVLGYTIEEIAHEKAGIIKPGVPVIANLTGPEAKVIARVAYEEGAPLIDVTKLRPMGTEVTSSGNRFSVQIDGIKYNGMETGMVGEHQIGNALCALTVIELLRKSSLISLEHEATIKGLKDTKLEGRFEIIKEDKKTVILDGAHNEQGAKALASTMESLYPNKKILTMYAIKKDKDYSSIMDQLGKFSSEFWAVGTFENENMEFDVNNIVSKIVNTNEYDLIVVTGSLYLIRAIRPELIRTLKHQNL